MGNKSVPFISGLLFSDPLQFGGDRQTHIVIGDMQWRRNLYPAIRPMHAQVQVLDVLADNLHLDIAHPDHAVIYTRIHQWTPFKKGLNTYSGNVPGPFMYTGKCIRPLFV